MIPPAFRTGPGPAERARTVLSHAPTAEIDAGTDLSVVLDVLAVDADGSLVLLVEAEGRLGRRLTAGPLPATLRAALVSPVPGPDRLLDPVTVRGVVGLAADVEAAMGVVMDAYADQPVDVVLRPDASVLLRMTVSQVAVDGERIGADAYARAAPDPLAAGSDDLVAHLLCERPDAVVQLAHLLDHGVVHGATGLAPIRVDRFGLTFRVDGPTGSQRARLDFPAPLARPDELPEAVRRLQERAEQRPACPFDDAEGSLM